MRFVILLSVLLSAFLAVAQDDLHCGTDAVMHDYYKKHPEAEQQKKILDQLRLQHRAGTMSTQTFTIPVVFHVLHMGGPENISDAQVKDALTILNRDYAKKNADTVFIIPEFRPIASSTGIHFELATIDPNGQCTNGIIHYYDADTDWFDAGIFRSHIGLESTQPRENITSSMSLVNVYEPYYFSGAKLTYLLSPKLSVQINAFNSFNSITETNTNKLFGGSVVYSPNNYISITYNFITGDDTPDTSFIKHQRYYHNLYGTYQKKKITIAAEFNYGIQDYSKYKNAYTLTTAYMNSCLLLLRHQSFKKIAFYGRGEWFSDEDEILSSGSGMGKYTWGATAGIEYKPLKNTAISLEGRYLESEKANFMYNGNLRKDRLEAILCVDAWF